MLTLAVALNLIVAVALAALAAKYLLGPVPADYYTAILTSDGAEVTENERLIFGTVNAVLGATFLGFALVIVFLALFGVLADQLWAKAALLIAGLVAAVPAAHAGRRLEQASSIRTPWRAGAAMSVVIVIAFLLAVI